MNARSLHMNSEEILKLKYQNFCLEKQGMVKVGKRQKKEGTAMKPTVLQLLREAPEGMGIGDTLVFCG